MIMNYLVANIQDVTLEKMAAHFGYQPKYLFRLIRQLFDQTFSQLKTETRVSISKSLLELTHRGDQRDRRLPQRQQLLPGL